VGRSAVSLANAKISFCCVSQNAFAARCPCSTSVQAWRSICWRISQMAGKPIVAEVSTTTRTKPAIICAGKLRRSKSDLKIDESLKMRYASGTTL
jgi:hypothetical protein